LIEDVTVALGTGGQRRSGVCLVDFDGETAGTMVQEILAEMRKNGPWEKIGSPTEDEVWRVTGPVICYIRLS
jgi:hypothetical protein